MSCLVMCGTSVLMECVPARRWEDFQAVMEEREPKMLRAFTAMEVDASGRLKTEQIQSASAAIDLGTTCHPGDALQICLYCFICWRQSLLAWRCSIAQQQQKFHYFSCCRHAAAVGRVRH